MPAYVQSNNPQSLQPGGVGYSFGSMDWPSQTETLEILPTVTPQAGSAFALTQPLPAIDPGSRTLTYETEFDVAPGALSVSLQVAMRNVDAEYETIDTNVATLATNVKSVTGVRALFARVIVNSITVGSATKLVAKILA